MGFVLTFLFPTIILIADEFGADEGPKRFTLLLWLISKVTPAKLFLLLVAILVMPFFVGRTGLGLRLREGVARRVGWVHKLRVGELLKMLAWSTDSGRPLSAALSSLARYHYDRDLRGKLLFARNEVEHGMPAWESLQASRILSPSETQAMVGATTNDSRAWLLRTMATRKEEDANVAAEAAVEQFHTLAILAIGGIVLGISVATIGSLARLVLSLV
jgi:type II secretory pathway component PulF